MSAAERTPSENSPQRDESALDRPALIEAAVEGTNGPAWSTALARPDRMQLLAARAKGLDAFPRVVQALAPVLQTTLAELKHLDRMFEIVGEEARERRENGQAIHEFAAEAALETGECLWGEDRHPIPAARLMRREVFCSDKHRALYRAKARARAAGYQAYDAAREAEIAARQADARAEVEDAEERALIEQLGRPGLYHLRRRYVALEARARRAVEREIERCGRLEAAVAANDGRTLAERATLANVLVAAKARAAARAAQLPRIGQRRLRVERAVARAWDEKGDRRRKAVLTPSTRYCPVNEAPLADEGDEFCSARCQRCWKRVDFRGAWGRLCARCQRWFDSAAPRIPVYADTILYESGWPQLLELDICSVECWAMCRAAQETPPAFPPARYLGPPPPFRSLMGQRVTKEAPGHHHDATAGGVAERPQDHAMSDRTELSALKTKIMDVSTAEPGLTIKEIRRRVGKKHSVVRIALSQLVDEGYLTREGRGRRGSPDRFRLPPVDRATSPNTTENRFSGFESESRNEFPL
jgi:DNA-binding transcriptional ArsR family regulator/predicted nucleic acid-binding Zn ribbon protein